MAHGHGHGIVEGENKRIAILISILALCLAIAETLGKSAQTQALSFNVEASNLWAFFQAKTIRKTTMETAAEHMEVDLARTKDPVTQELLKKRIEGWVWRVHWRPRRSATWRSRSTTTSNTGRPPSRSRSCWPRPT